MDLKLILKCTHRCNVNGQSTCATNSGVVDEEVDPLKSRAFFGDIY